MSSWQYPSKSCQVWRPLPVKPLLLTSLFATFVPHNAFFKASVFCAAPATFQRTLPCWLLRCWGQLNRSRLSIISFRPGELPFLLLPAAWLGLDDRLGLLGASFVFRIWRTWTSSLKARSSMLSGTSATDNQLAAWDMSVDSLSYTLVSIQNAYWSSWCLRRCRRCCIFQRPHLRTRL